MKIVYVANSIIPSRTANSIHVMKMCESFANNGHEVVLLVPNRYNEFESNINNIYDYYGVKKNFLIQRTFYKYIKGKNLFQMISIFNLINGIKPDIVFGRYLPGCFISLFNNTKIIYEAHAPYHNYSSFDKIILKKLMQSKKFINLVVISNALKNMYINEKLLKNKKILVAHDASDYKDSKDIISFNNQKRLKIGYFGHLYKGRGIELIIDLAKYFSAHEFHIVGGNSEDIEYWKNECISIPNLKFHGFIEPKSVYIYRNSCDILLAPYQKKVGVAGNSGDTSSFMSPLKIFEYMSSKKAIICSDLPVLREVLNERNSVLVACENLEDWINAIKLLEDKSNRLEISTAAYKDFQNNYTWDNRAKKVLEDVNND